MEKTTRLLSMKFDIADSILRLMETGEEDTERLRALRLEFDSIKVRYALATGHLYLMIAEGGEQGRGFARGEFSRSVHGENILEDLDRVVGLAGSLRGIPLERDWDTGETRLAADFGGMPGVGKGKRLTPTKLAASKPRTRRTKARTGPRGGAAGGGSAAKELEQRDIRRFIGQYQQVRIDLDLADKGRSAGWGKYNVCTTCGVEMVLCSVESELVCPGCDEVRPLIGAVFEDAQFYGQEGQKAKSGTFNPNRHFRFWFDRILARESEEELGDPACPEDRCGERLVACLRQIVERDHKILRFLGVKDIRAMLQEAGRTLLNKNVSLILKKLTGIGPPQPPEEVCQKVEKIFSIAIEICERLRRERRSSQVNRNYYPYYIFKILDAILAPDDGENRRILYYIYLQSDDTLEKNDTEWRLICEELPDIEWVRTDRAIVDRYRPR